MAGDARDLRRAGDPGEGSAGRGGNAVPSMDIVFTQILVILLYVVIGYAAGKCGLVDPEQRKYLTRVCTDLVLPFTILSASGLTVGSGELARMGMITGFILLWFGAVTLVSMRLQTRLGVGDAAKVTTASLLTYPNCTFLGLPLCRALFGDSAVLYNAMYLVAFNVLFFTWQASAFTGKRFRWRDLLTPPTAATGILVVMLALGWHFPAPVQTVTEATGAMITPLSLIIIGVMMSENRLAEILRERRAYLVTLFRNLAIPLLAMLFLPLLDPDPSVRLCLLVYMACPCATLTSIYAIKTDKEPEYAARSVLMSTLFFALTLPVMILIGGRFLG